jgi:hypothetical protein
VTRDEAARKALSYLMSDPAAAERSDLVIVGQPSVLAWAPREGLSHAARFPEPFRFTKHELAVAACVMHAEMVCAVGSALNKAAESFPDVGAQAVIHHLQKVLFK